jgi:hypothetical protein
MIQLEDELQKSALSQSGVKATSYQYPGMNTNTNLDAIQPQQTHLSKPQPGVQPYPPNPQPAQPGGQQRQFPLSSRNCR